MKYSADDPWIGFDLDGTLAEQDYDGNGQFHPLKIGKPIEPMVELLKQKLDEGYKVKIFTARVGPIGPSPNNKNVRLTDIHRAISDWTLEVIGQSLEATCIKDYNMIELYDDRAIHVVHNEGIICCPDDEEDVIF